MKLTAPKELPDLTTSTAIIPEWSQLPRSGQRDKTTGLSRACINSLILPTKANGFKPPVVSRSLKSHRLASRGIRLVNIASLLAYIQSQPSGFQTEEDRS